MLNTLFANLAKTLSSFSRFLNIGNGSTWPGHIALSLNPHIVEDLLKNSPTQVILIIGTNGKTTTSRILTTILKANNSHVVQNTSGANLVNGITSSLLLQSSKLKRQNSYAVFEVDENNVPIVLHHLTPKIIVALDLFRDQLDRYGELDSIAKKWNNAFQNLPDTTTLILNSDDPLIAYLAKDVKAKVKYFGLPDTEKGQKQLEHAADSIYCPNCGNKLEYKKIFYSHLGIWHCPNCGVKRPLPNISETTYLLPGTYNKYNTLAARLAAENLDVSKKIIDTALSDVSPAFGRQEKLTYKGKSVQIFLSKNPISMNESLRTIDVIARNEVTRQSPSYSSLSKRSASKGPSILFVLNDRIPDGRDVSWIWDIDIESYIDRFKSVYISGDRAWDMALRFAYASDKPYAVSHKLTVEEDLHKVIDQALEQIQSEETLFILPTYSAMLEVRKILTGKKIL